MKTLLAIVVLCVAGVLSEQLTPRYVGVPHVNEDSNEGRITNGETAYIGQFPYQVGLKLKLGWFSSSWCGGSLIANGEWVLTAAHCVQGVKSATVYLGATKRDSPQKTLSVTKSSLFAHPKYNEDTVQNDIALIKLPYRVQLSDSIETVEIPPTGYKTPTGEVAVVSGWGLESDDSQSVADSLNYAALEVASSRTCVKYFGRSTFTKNNICASTPDGTSTCQGDSGGPLVDKAGVQVGIVSYGSSQGCEKGYPVAFTRVSGFTDWINEMTGSSY